MWRVLALAAMVAAAAPAGAQGTAEAAGAARRSMYPAKWPAGPRPDSVPAWARPGLIRFARWDGGPIETAKAMVSGWPGFNPPIPDYLYTMTNWYDPATVALLREAGVNLIWVTFSNGFANETERFQQELLRRYIDACHRQGIRVMAYESIANMFWEDMYAKVPESRGWAAMGKDGKPVAYGAAQYKAMGRITRYMADMANPGWRAYLRGRIDLALDAGADGVIYDNNFGDALFETYDDIYRYGASRKADFLLMGNFHANTYVFNRLVNAITTEDGQEPGVYAEAALRRGRIGQERDRLPEVAGGRLVNNIGLHRIHAALSEGWKPAMIEHGRREADGEDVGNQRLRGPMSGPRYQLTMAESMMFSVGTELFVEGGFAHGLMRRDPETVAIWRDIGRYNRFFADNAEYYTGTQSLAPAAIVFDDRSESVPLLNGLAARNALYDVLYEHDLTAARLRPYRAVALLTAETVRASALQALEQYAAAGGKLLAAAGAAATDENGRARPRPAWLSRGVYWEKLPNLDELARALREAAGTPAVAVEAPPGILYNAVSQPDKGRVLVHLLNYILRPAGKVKVTAREPFGAVRILSPDSGRAAPRRVSPRELEADAPAIYTVLLLEKSQ